MSGGINAAERLARRLMINNRPAVFEPPARARVYQIIGNAGYERLLDLG